MARVEIYRVIQDQSGNILTNVTLAVHARNSDGTSGSAASFYAAYTGGVALTPPYNYASGVIKCYVAPGAYNLKVNGSGFPEQVLMVNALDNRDAAAYTASNVTTDRTIDANATTIDELADVTGTLINDLKTAGVIV